MGIGIGAVVWLLVQSLILPDRWAVWLARRQNLPRVISLPVLVLSAIFMLNMAVAVGASFFTRVRMEPWVYWGLVPAVMALVLAFGNYRWKWNLWPFVLTVVMFTGLGCGVQLGDGSQPTVTPVAGARQATATPAAPYLAPTATPAPAAQATATPVPAPVSTPQPVVGVVCRADKIGTWSEVQAGGPQRIEITIKDGRDHLDYYRDRGVPAVSVIVQDGEVAVLQGFGSIWYFPSRDCLAFDNVKDARDYGESRMASWNHSGIVYGSLKDYLEDKPPVVNLRNADTRSVRPTVLQGAPAPPTTAASPPQPAQASAAPAVVACPDGVREADHPPVVNQTWTPNGEWRVVNFWTNMPGKDQKERKLLLSPDQNPKLLGGGSSWSWPTSCEQVARANYDGNQLPRVTLAELQAESLVST